MLARVLDGNVVRRNLNWTGRSHSKLMSRTFETRLARHVRKLMNLDYRASLDLCWSVVEGR